MYSSVVDALASRQRRHYGPPTHLLRAALARRVAVAPYSHTRNILRLRVKVRSHAMRYGDARRRAHY